MNTHNTRSRITRNTSTPRRNVCRRHRKSSLIDKRLFRVSFMAFLIVFICVAGIMKVTAEGSEKPVQKQYKSIEIEQGDTLWDIALEYNDSSISKCSTTEYIDDIKTINNLVRDDKITAGNYIIVPIYVVAEE